MKIRRLGRSEIEVSTVGMGCWAIGGSTWRDGRPVGWGEVDDEESTRAIRRAVELGVTLFDTADAYGCGHSERVLGKALVGRRDQVVIATKFGSVFDEQTRQITGSCSTPEHIRSACDASLRRLGTDRLDLYQLHIGDLDLDVAGEVRETLEDLVCAGKIRTYGWSTDDPERVRAFAAGRNCSAAQHNLNLLAGSEQVLAVCEQEDLASINRSPFQRGLLTGKFTSESRLPDDDVRHDWDLTGGALADQLAVVEQLQPILREDGRTPAQAALGWLLARSDRTIPIPGFKTAAQVEENAGVLRKGPLSPDQMGRIAAIVAAGDGE